MDNTFDWADPTYTWSQDNSICTAVRVCIDDGLIEIESVYTMSIQITTATCEGQEVTNYTKTFENTNFLPQTKIVPTAAGHTWSEEWSSGEENHWHECTVCHNAKNEEATHTLVHEDSLEAAKENAGHIEVYSCSVCGKHFSDEEGLEEISEADWTIPKGYSIYDLNRDGFVNVLDVQLHYNVVAAAA